MESSQQPHPEPTWKQNTEAVREAIQDPDYRPEDVEELGREAYAGIGEYQKSAEFSELITEEEVITTARETLSTLENIATKRGQSFAEMLADPAFVDRVLSGETAGMDPRDRVRILGLVATVVRPESAYYKGETVPSHSMESSPDKTWRKAINSLYSFANDEPSPQKIYAAADDESLSRQLENRVRSAAQARYWLTTLSAESNQSAPNENTAVDLQEKVEQSTAIDLADFISVPIALLNFTALPPGEAEYDTSGQPRNISPEEAVLSEMDPERVRVIVELLERFKDKNPRFYLSKRETRSGKVHRDMLAVTVFDIDSGHEVALAERPAGHIHGNESAIFILDERKMAGTWQEVLSLPRREARQLGASRVIHESGWQADVNQRLEAILS